MRIVPFFRIIRCIFVNYSLYDSRQGRNVL
jgi:hypothetical protein